MIDPWASRPYPSAKQMIPAPPNIAFTFVNFRAAGGLETFRRIFLAIFHQLARGSVIGEDHLVLGDQSITSDDLTLGLAITRHVQSVLTRCAGDEAAAAELLGITKKKLKDLL